MSKKEVAKKAAVQKEAVQEEAVQEVLSYIITLPDGNKIEGSTGIREFQPNVAKGFQNSGYQVKVSNGNYSGSIMIIDYLKQKKI